MQRTQEERLVCLPKDDGLVAPSEEQRQERVRRQHVQREQRGHGARGEPAEEHCLVAGGGGGGGCGGNSGPRKVLSSLAMRFCH